jgi:DNA-binding LacI/PurR family transcriptional regulator
MEDVAARAGVSRALVSIVFRDQPGASPANRERVRRAAEQIGFRPDRRASLLGRKRTNLIGVAFGVGHEFHGELVSAVYTAAARRQLEVVLSGVTALRAESQAIAELLAFRCDALLLLAPDLSATAVASLAAEVPVVVLARHLRAAGADVVRTDDHRGAWLATQHLLGLGHRAILHLDGARAAGAAERRRGFRAAMRAAGLPDARLLPGGLTEADGSRAARAYLAQRSTRAEAPTGVAAFNDQCATGFLATLRDAGVRVPAEVSLVGYDDSPLAAASWTQLTTIRQDASALADRAVERVLAHLAGNPDPVEVLVEPSLVVRSTTAAAPRS